jgi:hypothetical protein
VDISLLGETVHARDTAIGSWVNIIGYVERDKGEKRSTRAKNQVKVQALMLWSAGSIDTVEYGDAVVGRNETT